MEKELSVSAHLKDNQFIKRFIQHYQNGELITPTIPDVALKIRKAIEQDCEVSDLVKIINMDPVISGKLIQVVNSPFYMLSNPISNCLNAINHLGRKTTRDMVIAFSMKNLIKSDRPNIRQLIQQCWMQSVKVSSLSYTLCKLVSKADPNEALLAGLLHNVGVLPILSFANNLPENSYQAVDIEHCMNEFQGQIGSIILDEWDFPAALRTVPLESSDWYANTADKIDLTDIVILAKYHYFLNAPSLNTLPFIDSLPAYQKLGDQTLTPEMSLQILHDAKQQVADAMRFFSF
jgi:HD-like signal output (HDOD) protein